MADFVMVHKVLDLAADAITVVAMIFLCALTIKLWFKIQEIGKQGKDGE